MFLHDKQTENDTENDTTSIDKESKQKCDTCKFDSDKVKVHEIKEQRFTLCCKCDKIIEHKEILVTKNFDMKDHLSVVFRDKSLKEIAKMVNY